ncbi:hypothetical protein SAMN05443287_108141 [Micromonospora phaseoli]|uniref:Uncharacterized protein n=1 Tax=Micromonospora phaseoli TaxID=1144548 RepID=A0A1H7C0E6_9ACTN|nr:hypothetical protein [Micromonospora phaseoli]PZV92720.1 hypothetical protein CLV64_110143 [Micromonospora phaseoli]GIJ76626.1 hypothetical protein Xph01_10580 [Micromonospora phaseoli]SEJ82926.1 hypothetical protein SAMN05443287_108141 [Micromonospora phaseoli]
MIILGYLDGYEPPILRSPLVDGSDVMSHALFWPAFLATVGGAASAPDAFDIDPADLEQIVDVFLDPHRWPVFSLPLSGPCRLHVIMRNFEDEGGVDYVLDPGTGNASIPLAAMEGHFRGPAFAWPEVVAAAHQPDPDHTPAERLLLLVPACADSNRPNEAVDLVAEALATLGARSDLGQVSEELLNNRRYWAPCRWTYVDDVLVGLGPHTYRRHGGELSPEQLHLIAATLQPAQNAVHR